MTVGLLAVSTAARLAAAPAPPHRWPVERVELPFAQPSIHALEFDPRGPTLWLGSPSELARFDGERATWVDAPDVVISRSLTLAGDELLVGTLNGLLLSFDGDGWAPLSERLGQSDFHAVADDEGGAWVGNSFHGPQSRLRYYRDGALAEVEGGEDLREVEVLELDPWGRLWLVSFGRLRVFEVAGGRLQRELTPPPPPPGVEIGMIRDFAFADGTVWLLHELGVLRLDGDSSGGSEEESWTPLDGAGLSVGPLHRILIDGEGRPWVAGERGLAHFSLGRWWTLEEVPVSASVGWPPALAFDALGTLWVGSTPGLYRVRLDLPRHRLGAFDRVLAGGESAAVEPLEGLAAHGGAIWLFGRAGLWRWNLAELADAESPLVRLLDGPVAALAPHPRRDTLWALVASPEPLSFADELPMADGSGLPPGLYEVDETGARRLGPPPPVSLSNPSLVIDPDDRAWLAVRWDNRVFRWASEDGRADESWEAVFEAPRFEGGSGVPGLTLGEDRRIWACLVDRVACFDGERLILSEPIDSPRPVKLNLHGDVVAAAGGGAFAYGPWRSLVRARLDGGVVALEAVDDQGLDGRIPESDPRLLRDDSGLWLLSDDRLFRHDGQRWWEAGSIGEENAPWPHRVVDAALARNGLVSLGLDASREMWLALLPLRRPAARPRIDASSAIRETSTSDDVTIAYHGSSWNLPAEALLYRLEIDDFNAEPRTLWTRDANRTWNGLAHGTRYRVKVHATDPLGGESEPLVFDREVRLPLSRRPWFLPATVSLTIFAASLLSVGLYRVALRFQAHGYRTVEKTFGPPDAARLAPLLEEAEKLGPAPSLAQLGALGARLGDELPAAAWPPPKPRPWQRDRRLVLRARDGAEALLALPWEAAVAPGREDRFLGRTANVTVLRCAGEWRPRPRPARIRVLHLAASPHGEAPLDDAAEAAELEKILRRAAGRTAVELRSSATVEPGAERPSLTRRRLLGLLREFPSEVVHLTCHGRLRHGRFELLLEDEAGERAPLAEEQWVEIVRDLADRGGGERRRPRLLVLNACSVLGAGGELPAPFGSRLLLAGLEGVVGFQFEVGSRSAAIFYNTFYPTWLRHGQADWAAQRGRAAVRALRGAGLHDFAAPSLFCASADGRVAAP